MPKPKHSLDDGDARTWRVTYRLGDNLITREVVALYHVMEDALVTFKDNAHAAVFTVAQRAVLSIERLRTAVLLSIGAEELQIILDSLHTQAETLEGTSVPGADGERKSKNYRGAIAALAESLERLRPIAAQHHAEDPCSMPRVPQLLDA